jgi:enamine deaminase RidA (YjgF/YER057c/UK114 family)
MTFFRFVLLISVVSTLCAAPQRRKKEEQTQVLQVPKELPAAVVGETRRLTFRVTPLSGRGLLSQQIREALKAVSRDAGNETVLKIRAFVAGSGDLRRVRDLVSEHFTDRRQPLPALSLVQSGGLPMEGAQVVFEYITVARKDVNPQGLVFLSSHTAESENPTDPVAPLTTRALAAFRQTIADSGSEPADVLRVTCFFSSLESLAASRQQVEAAYPRAALNYVQTQRVPGRGLAACEGVARARRSAGNLSFIAAPDLSATHQINPRAALVAAPQVVLTGTQVSFGFEERDARLAFERLKRAVEQAGGSIRDVAFVHYYPLAGRIALQVGKVRAEFFGPTAESSLVFEGLPGQDAGFAVDVIAVKN